MTRIQKTSLEITYKNLKFRRGSAAIKNIGVLVFTVKILAKYNIECHILRLNKAIKI
jgi:DUF4097 and DUF4098 domain-containing protein YvlB